MAYFCKRKQNEKRKGLQNNNYTQLFLGQFVIVKKSLLYARMLEALTRLKRNYLFLKIKLNLIIFIFHDLTLSFKGVIVRKILKKSLRYQDSIIDVIVLLTV